MIKAGGAGRGRRAAFALPGVERDVVVIAAGRDEGGAFAPRGHLEAEHAAIERERSLDVGDLEMNVSYADAGVDRMGRQLHVVFGRRHMGYGHGGARSDGLGGYRGRAPGRTGFEREGLFSNRHHALGYCWSMIFSENRYPLSASCSSWRAGRPPRSLPHSASSRRRGRSPRAAPPWWRRRSRSRPAAAPQATRTPVRAAYARASRQTRAAARLFPS